MFSRFSANGVQSGSLLATVFPAPNHYGIANFGFALRLRARVFDSEREKILYMRYKYVDLFFPVCFY